MTETMDQKNIRALLCAQYEEFKKAVTMTHNHELHMFWRNSAYVITIEQVGGFTWVKFTQVGIETWVVVLEIMFAIPSKTIHTSNIFELTDAVIRDGVRNIVRYWEEEVRGK